MNFIDRLNSFIEDNKLKQIDIVNKAGISRGFLSMILKGKRQPSLELLNALSEMSGKSINWWLHGKEEYDNLDSLNSLVNYLIEKGFIESDGSMDKEYENILLEMLKKEIKVKLQKAQL